MSEDGTNTGRRRFLLGSTSVVGVVGVAAAAVPFVGSWNPSAKARAAGAPVRVDISRLEEGGILGPIPAWRGRPIFIVRRSQEALAALDALVASRVDAPADASYTARLFAGGVRRIAQKVGEEGVETALAAVAQDDDALLGEAADLVYHLVVLLRARGLGWADVQRVLAARSGAAPRG